MLVLNLRYGSHHVKIQSLTRLHYTDLQFFVKVTIIMGPKRSFYSHEISTFLLRYIDHKIFIVYIYVMYRSSDLNCSDLHFCIVIIYQEMLYKHCYIYYNL